MQQFVVTVHVITVKLAGYKLLAYNTCEILLSCHSVVAKGPNRLLKYLEIVSKLNYQVRFFFLSKTMS